MLSSTVTKLYLDDEEYPIFERGITRAFAAAVQDEPLFTTDAADLFPLFLSKLPAARRQHYNCHNCRHFFERYGGLVTIDANGKTSSPVWDDTETPPFFARAVTAVRSRVHRAKVTGVFVSDQAVLGTPVTRIHDMLQRKHIEWHHLHVVNPAPFKSTRIKNAEQRAAELLEDYRMLCRSLGEFPKHHVAQAVQLLTSGNLYRSDKCVETAKWLLDLHVARLKPGTNRDNLTWRAVATAPAGWCHVRSGMIGTLLEDIGAGLPFIDIKRRFDSKMDPLHYQRPQAAPKAGTILQAERIVAELQSAGSLARRFARLDDVETLWRPDPPPPATGGVFGHLRKNVPPATIWMPSVTMTWEKFQRTVLADAASIELDVPSHGNFAAMVAPVNPSATPIIQWPSQITWYLYHGGSTCQAWNLSPGWREVTAIAPQPGRGNGTFFLLRGAYDTRHDQGGGFFPEQLKSEYHGVRSVMEAYAALAPIAGKLEATACGLKCEGAAPWNISLRVTTRSGAVQVYKIDRWD